MAFIANELGDYLLADNLGKITVFDYGDGTYGLFYVGINQLTERLAYFEGETAQVDATAAKDSLCTALGGTVTW